MDKRPERDRFAASAQAARMTALGTEVQGLNARRAALAATPPAPRQDAPQARVPPSQTPTPPRPTSPPRGTRRDASVGRAGGEVPASGSRPSQQRPGPDLSALGGRGTRARATRARSVGQARAATAQAHR